MAATIDDRIAETRAQIIAACELAGVDQEFIASRLTVDEQGRDYTWNFPGNGKLFVTVLGGDHKAAGTFRELKDGALNLTAIVSRVIELDHKHAEANANVAALATTPHPGLHATADAEGIHVTLTPEQFVRVAALLRMG